MSVSAVSPPADSASRSSTENVVIVTPRDKLTEGIGELFARRELLLFLIWRDIKVRYKQTVLGVAWAVLQSRCSRRSSSPSSSAGWRRSTPTARTRTRCSSSRG